VALAHHGIDNMFPTSHTSTWCVASRDHFCQTDNSELTIHKRSTLSQAGKDNINTTLFGSWDTTDLNVTRHSTPTMTGPSETDIIYGVNPDDVPSGFTGWTWCDDTVGSFQFKCDQHFVKFEFNPSVALACHETGHAVGLTHGDDADPQVSNQHYELRCMRTPVPEHDPYVGPHNVERVNSVY
jgi:hypothetical protein